MSQERKRLTAEQKAQVVRRHVAGKEQVSDLADEYGVQPSQIHIWVKTVLDQAEHAFRGIGRPPKGDTAPARQIERLQAKLAQKNEVIAELLEENVRAKKAAGEL
jgi:transposase